MRKFIIVSLTIFSFFILSCSKELEDRIAGKWQLEGAWKSKLFGRDYFQTGYENGIFTFFDNGSATYIEGSDTLSGYWRSDWHNRYYYNSGSGEWETRSMKYLSINLVNFQQNRRLEWEFDDFHFKSNWQKIKAEQYSLSNGRVYEFGRR
ncbi:MAG TPA: hypothetical protein VN451_05225 [Chitinophagaceae bacterium]|nr:hypothetical protein [Chitinophagaceae bacterium]